MIRSWSGARLLNEEDQFLSSSFEDKDVLNWNSNLIKDFDETTSSFECALSTYSEYDDGHFTEVEICDKLGESVKYCNCESRIDNVSIRACNDGSGDEEMCKSLRRFSPQECLSPIEINEQSCDKVTSCRNYNSTCEMNCANVRYRKWLSEIQKTMYHKRQRVIDFSRMKNEKEAKRRKDLVLKARTRRRVAYYHSTEAARYSRIDRLKCETDTLNNRKGIDTQQVQERRKRLEMKHKEYLDTLTKQRTIELIQEENERKRADKIKRQARAKMMDEIKKHKELLEHISDQKVVQEKKSNEKALQGNKIEDELKTHESNSSNRVDKFKQRLIAEFTTMVIERQRKEEEATKLERRLNKRAVILRQKYENKNLHRSKPWEEKGIIPPKYLNEDTGKSEVHNCEDGSQLPTGEEEISKLVLTPAQVKALAARLYSKYRPKESAQCANVGNNYDTWKDKNGLESDQKVFCLTGWYPSIRDDLLRRGWFFNQDKESNHFDFKFSLASSDIDFSALHEYQMTNHFKSSTCLTTKVGLCNTLRHCQFFGVHNSDMYDFFPRSYSLSFPPDVYDFLDDFLCLQAVASLQRLLQSYQKRNRTFLNDAVFNMLISFIHKYTYVVDDTFLDSSGAIEEHCFSPIHSTIIQRADELLYREVTESDFKEQYDLVGEIKNMLLEKNQIDNDNEGKKERKISLRLMSKVVEMNDKHASLINLALDKYNSSNSSQCNINGTIAENIWIMKPGGKSRGRGIAVVQSLDCIVQHIMTESDSRSKLNQWVIQKYIENPLVVAKRKFDIRQWVMVTDWNPVTIWFNVECYIRFAVLEYEEEGGRHQHNSKWANNKFRHLVNNSIGKKSKDFTKTFKVDEINDVVEGYMWSLDKFKQWLIQTTGEDKWEQSILTRIKKIIIDTILSCQENMIAERKRSWEIYGFDIMIDYCLNPWLIEVNSSPACDYSTNVTESFIKKALPDALKVVLDTKVHHEDTSQIDTGGWECIYYGKNIPKVTAGLGTIMSLQGEKINIKRLKKKVNTKQVSLKDKIESVLVFDDSDLSNYEETKESVSRKDSCLSYHDRQNNKLNKENYGAIYDTSIDNHLRKMKIKKNNLFKNSVPLKKAIINF